MANESKTPIADQVRKMELELNNFKRDLNDLIAIRNEVAQTDAQRYPVVHPVTSMSNLMVDKTDYLVLLGAHMNVLNADIAELESKLTTVYAAVNNCLGDDNG
ncbi:hypothetical protein pVco14_072 [Vibrio phage pVco-14]|nr:hypothetical protein pVco14_072 [Vibrio phage pVco-14]